MKKQLWSVLLTAAIAVTALAGCGGGASEKTTQAAGGEKQEEAQQVTLRFVSWLTQYEDLDRKVADAYEAEHPNVKVEFEYYGDMTATEYYKKVDLMVVGGENMDILMASALPEFKYRASSGTYLPLDKYFEAEGVKPEDAYSIMPKIKGEVYGVPGDLKYQIVYINKTYLDEAGLEVPSLDWTWDDYREYAKAMTKGEGASKRYGSYFHSWDHYDVMGMWSTYPDNPMLTADDTAVNFDNPLFSDWLQFRYDMEQKDQCQVSYTDVKAMNMSYRDKFFNGDVAMLPVGSFLVSELSDQDKYPHDFVTTFAPIPAWKDAETGTTYTDSQYYAICKNSKNPQEAYDFLRFYTTKGMEIKANSVSGETGADKMYYFDKMISNPDYVDVEALNKVITNPDFKELIYNNTPSYHKELSNLMVDEVGRFLLNESSLEAAIDSLVEKGNRMIEEKGTE